MQKKIAKIIREELQWKHFVLLGVTFFKAAKITLQFFRNESSVFYSQACRKQQLDFMITFKWTKKEHSVVAIHCNLKLPETQLITLCCVV